MSAVAPARRRPRVLVVTYNFPPHAAIGTMRTLRQVRHLAETGWEVEVLASDPRTFRPVTPVDEALLARVPSSVRVVRAGAWRWMDGPTRGTRTSTPATSADVAVPVVKAFTDAVRAVEPVAFHCHLTALDHDIHGRDAGQCLQTTLDGLDAAAAFDVLDDEVFLHGLRSRSRLPWRCWSITSSTARSRRAAL